MIIAAPAASIGEVRLVLYLGAGNRSGVFMVFVKTVIARTKPNSVTSSVAAASMANGHSIGFKRYDSKAAAHVLNFDKKPNVPGRLSKPASETNKIIR